VLPAIPQIEEDFLFGREDLRAGCASGTYEDIDVGEAREAVSMGRIVSSAFVVLQGRSEEDGTVCDKFLSAEPVLAERVGEDGDSFRLFFEPGEEQPSDELGCEVEVQAL
jgi:hypothetical protein